MNKAMAKIINEIKLAYFVCLIFKMDTKKNDNKSDKETINNCPISIPKLNENNGNNMFSSLPNICFNKLENPKPCINPKSIVSINSILWLMALLLVELIIFKTQVITIVIGIKNSTKLLLIFKKFNTLNAKEKL